MHGSLEQISPSPMPPSVVALPTRPRAAGREPRPLLDAEGVRLVLRALLFNGSSVPAWHDDAVCASPPHSRPFSETDGMRPRAATVRAAKRVCLRCPVRAICLEDAMAHESPSYRHGVVGGLSPVERHRLHRAVLKATS